MISRFYVLQLGLLLVIVMTTCKAVETVGKAVKECLNADRTPSNDDKLILTYTKTTGEELGVTLFIKGQDGEEGCHAKLNEKVITLTIPVGDHPKCGIRKYNGKVSVDIILQALTDRVSRKDLQYKIKCDFNDVKQRPQSVTATLKVSDVVPTPITDYGTGAMECLSDGKSIRFVYHGSSTTKGVRVYVKDHANTEGCFADIHDDYVMKKWNVDPPECGLIKIGLKVKYAIILQMVKDTALSKGDVEYSGTCDFNPSPIVPRSIRYSMDFGSTIGPKAMSAHIKYGKASYTCINVLNVIYILAFKYGKKKVSDYGTVAQFIQPLDQTGCSTAIKPGKLELTLQIIFTDASRKHCGIILPETKVVETTILVKRYEKFIASTDMKYKIKCDFTEQSYMVRSATIKDFQFVTVCKTYAIPMEEN